MTTRRDLLRATAMLPAFGALPVLGASPSKLHCEPLAGHFTHDSVRIWFQATDSVKASLNFRPVDGGPDDGLGVRRVVLETQHDNSVILEISKTQTRHALRVLGVAYRAPHHCKALLPHCARAHCAAGRFLRIHGLLRLCRGDVSCRQSRR